VWRCAALGNTQGRNERGDSLLGSAGRKLRLGAGPPKGETRCRGRGDVSVTGPVHLRRDLCRAAAAGFPTWIFRSQLYDPGGRLVL
jgi:hypothetical protein